MKRYVWTNGARRFALAVLVLGLLPGAGLSPLVPGLPATSAIAVDPNLIRISADQQIYDLEKKRYALSGNVHVAFQDLIITSTKAEMAMDPEGKPQTASFFNRPTFRRVEKPGEGRFAGEDRVIGDTIRLYLGNDQFGAEGNVESYITTVAADPFIIRSDVQQFDRKSGAMAARGNVFVDYNGSKASSQEANVRMSDNGKAERVIFSGSARLKKENSEMSGNKITVMVESGNLIAENNVNTHVDLKGETGSPQKVLITSDYQQYDKSSDMMIASGNVRIIYGDYNAVGAKATFKMNNGQLDRIFLTGRPTITEQGRVITADKITITTNPKNFDAVGNVKVQLKTGGSSLGGGSASPASSGSAKPSASAPKLPSDDELDY